MGDRRHPHFDRMGHAERGLGADPGAERLFPLLNDLSAAR